MLNSELQKNYLSLMGIDVWQLKSNVAEPSDPQIIEEASNCWQSLQQQVKNCTACSLHQSRTQTVFGVGSTTADLLIVGEAPGMHEDLQGEPFVGRAGQLLNAMMQAIGLSRQEIYIANVLKCRPPNNRDPKPEEVQTCTPFLEQQVDLLKPKIILAVGRVAAHYLLGTDLSMSQLRGKQYTFRDTDIPLLVTYHPAYLLRSPAQKTKSYADLLRVKAILDQI